VVSRRILTLIVAIALTGCGAPVTSQPDATLAPCRPFDPPPLNVGAEIQHLKTSASVVAVTTACSVRVVIAGGGGTLARFTNKEIVLRATSRTTFGSAPQGDLAAIGRFGLKSGEVFTLSFDSRPFSDGSYPINFMNR
jgi:hypothetical protein